jgi:sugar phosphate isomerase/epimerase
MRLGGPVFLKTDDPEELALQHQKIGYRAAYCPDGISVRDTAQIQAYREAFKKKDIVFAEVGAWCNPLDAKEGVAEKNIVYITERLALAEELGALCCVNIVGTHDADSWFAPHSRNFSDETFERTVAIARRVIDAVKPKTTKFTLEMFCFTFLDGPAEYVRLLKAVDRPRMGVHLDPANCVVSPRTYYNNGLLIRECFKTLGPNIVSCHAKDIRIRPEPFSVQFDEVIPGRGILDYGEFLRGANSLKQDVPLMMEHLSKEEEYREAQKYILSVAAGMGIAV